MNDDLKNLFECLLNSCPTPKRCGAEIVTAILERRRAALERGTKAELEEAETAILMACRIAACPMEIDPGEESSYAPIKYDA